MIDSIILSSDKRTATIHLVYPNNQGITESRSFNLYHSENVIPLVHEFLSKQESRYYLDLDSPDTLEDLNRMLWDSFEDTLKVG